MQGPHTVDEVATRSYHLVDGSWRLLAPLQSPSSNSCGEGARGWLLALGTQRIRNLIFPIKRQVSTYELIPPVGFERICVED